MLFACARGAMLLHDIAPTDPATLISISLSMIAVVLLATLIPAHRVASADPTTALRTS
jgi:ABC-type lipoprotein release transport system permease subunit